MSAPVIYLLRTGHGDHVHVGSEPPECLLRDAWRPYVDRDAVAELIEAAKELHLVSLPYGDGRDSSAEVGAARTRICAALAKVGAP